VWGREEVTDCDMSQNAIEGRRGSVEATIGKGSREGLGGELESPREHSRLGRKKGQRPTPRRHFVTVTVTVTACDCHIGVTVTVTGCDCHSFSQTPPAIRW
jgi:hypothetical protein